MDLDLRHRNVSTPAGHQWIAGTPDALEGRLSWPTWPRSMSAKTSAINDCRHVNRARLG